MIKKSEIMSINDNFRELIALYGFKYTKKSNKKLKKST